MENEYSWLTPSNGEKCKWAHHYLTTKLGLSKTVIGESDYNMCLKILGNQNQDRRDMLLMRMKAAWRQREYRYVQKRNGYKSCSFFLRNRTLKELERLSKETNKTLNETLEELIHQTYLTNKEIKSSRRNSQR